MEEKGIQVIVETHSDHMLNRLRRRIAQAKLEDLDDNLFEKCGIYFAERTGGVTDFPKLDLTKSATYDMTDFPKGFFDQGAKMLFIFKSISRGVNMEYKPIKHGSRWTADDYRHLSRVVV